MNANSLHQRLVDYFQQQERDICSLSELCGLPASEFRHGIPERLNTVDAWHKLWADFYARLTFAAPRGSRFPAGFAISLFIVSAYRGFLEAILATLRSSNLRQSSEFRIVRLAGELESLEALTLEIGEVLFSQSGLKASGGGERDGVSISAVIRSAGFVGEYFEGVLRFLEEHEQSAEPFLEIDKNLQIFTIALFRIRSDTGIGPQTEALAAELGLITAIDPQI